MWCPFWRKSRISDSHMGPFKRSCHIWTHHVAVSISCFIRCGPLIRHHTCTSRSQKIKLIVEPFFVVEVAHACTPQISTESVRTGAVSDLQFLSSTKFKSTCENHPSNFAMICSNIPQYIIGQIFISIVRNAHVGSFTWNCKIWWEWMYVLIFLLMFFSEWYKLKFGERKRFRSFHPQQVEESLLSQMI